jgi:predicted TIM-barrel fold metal-dependent hydrolase
MLISADCHAGAPGAGYKPYLDRRYWDLYADYVHAQGIMYHGKMEEIMGGDLFHKEQRDRFHAQERVASGGKTGVFAASRRVQELEADGCVGEVIFPDHQNENEPPFGVIEDVGGYPADVQLAGVRAYNRWLAEFCSQFPERMAGVALVPVDDVDAAVEEIRWVRSAGLRGGIVLPLIPDHTRLPQYHHSRYEPIWAVCEELDLPVHTHATGGTPAYGRERGSEAVYITEVVWYAHRPFWMLLWSGVFERHPRLKFVMTEQGVGWIPAALAQLDGMYDNVGSADRPGMPQFREGLSLRPSEYWARQCFAGATGLRPEEAGLRHVIGAGKMMWGSDYPHLEGTWPHTPERVRTTFAGVPEREMRLILGETAAMVYNFDVAKLLPVVEHIGPEPRELATA